MLAIKGIHFLSLWVYFGHTHGMWTFLGQGSNPSLSSDNEPHQGPCWILNHWATRELLLMNLMFIILIDVFILLLHHICSKSVLYSFHILNRINLILMHAIWSSICFSPSHYDFEISACCYLRFTQEDMLICFNCWVVHHWVNIAHFI